MLKKQHSPLAEIVKPTVDFVEQTFDIRLFDKDKNPLKRATDMLCMINKMGEDGKKCERQCRELEDTPGDGKQKPLLPKFLANIMIVVCSILSTMVTITIILVLMHHWLWVLNCPHPCQLHYNCLGQWQICTLHARY